MFCTRMFLVYHDLPVDEHYLSELKLREACYYPLLFGAGMCVFYVLVFSIFEIRIERKR